MDGSLLISDLKFTSNCCAGLLLEGEATEMNLEINLGRPRLELKVYSQQLFQLQLNKKFLNCIVI